jgi:inosose dehydratase
MIQCPSMRLTRREWISAALATPLLAAPGNYRLGITTNTRGGWEDDVFLSFREAKEAGYGYVESFSHYFVKYFDRPAALEEEMKKIGMRFVTISNGGPLEMHFEDPSKHDKIIEDHLKLVRFIRHFGCTHLKINCGPRKATGTTADDLKYMAEVLGRLGKKVSAEGLKFAVHAHMWSQFETRAEIDYILGHTDPKHVWFVLDTGHITMAGIDPVKLARELGHRVIEFHMKDTKPENLGGAKSRLDRPDMMKDPPFFELGKGGVDFAALKKHLDGIQWKGWLTVELDSSPWKGPKESARVSREYLRGNWGI